MLVIRDGIRKMFVRIAIGEDPDQSDQGLHCFSWPFWDATSVHNFRSYIPYMDLMYFHS